MILAKRKNWSWYFALFLCVLAFANMVFFEFRYGGVCLDNWGEAWGQLLLVFAASLALLSKHWINHLFAAFAVLPRIYDVVVEVFAPWGYGPRADVFSPENLAISGLTMEIWWRMARLHSADFVTPALSLMIVIYAFVGLSSNWRKPTAQNLR